MKMCTEIPLKYFGRNTRKDSEENQRKLVSAMLKASSEIEKYRRCVADHVHVQKDYIKDMIGDYCTPDKESNCFCKKGDHVYVPTMNSKMCKCGLIKPI